MNDDGNVPAPQKCIDCEKPTFSRRADGEGGIDLEGQKLPSADTCGKGCQTIPSAKRDDICATPNVRRILLRAADTIQEAFFNFRKHSFQYELQGFKSDGSLTTVVREPPRFDYIAKEFDDSIVTDQNDRSAILSTLHCTHSVAIMRELVDAALRGIVTSIEELRCGLHSQPRLVVYEYMTEDKARDVSHDVFRIYLKSGEPYILDFTGHQYGLHDPVLPASEFFKSRVRWSKLLQCNGSLKKEIIQKARRRKYVNARQLSEPLTWHYAVAMAQALVEWEKKPDQRLDRILALPEEQYLTKRKEFLEYLYKSGVSFRKKLVEQGLINYTSAGFTLPTRKSCLLPYILDAE